MTLFNFFPKDKAFKSRLNSIQKESSSNNENTKYITRNIKFKKIIIIIKLSQTNENINHIVKTIKYNSLIEDDTNANTKTGNLSKYKINNSINNSYDCKINRSEKL